jgi:hypothetical protein
VDAFGGVVIARFIGGSMDGKTGPVFAEVPHTWNVPVPPEPQGVMPSPLSWPKVVLGLGYHYGEWYGSGIQRGYGLTEKRFALFNVDRWQSVANDLAASVPGLEVVPVIDRDLFGDGPIEGALDSLRRYGSFAAPRFMRPEGIVVWHHAARQKFKVLLENDALPKSLAEAA